MKAAAKVLLGCLLLLQGPALLAVAEKEAQRSPSDLDADESRYKVRAKPEPYQPPRPAPLSHEEILLEALLQNEPTTPFTTTTERAFEPTVAKKARTYGPTPRPKGHVSKAKQKLLNSKNTKSGGSKKNKNKKNSLRDKFSRRRRLKKKLRGSNRPGVPVGPILEPTPRPRRPATTRPPRPSTTRRPIPTTRRPITTRRPSTTKRPRTTKPTKKPPTTINPTSTTVFYEAAPTLPIFLSEEKDFLSPSLKSARAAAAVFESKRPPRPYSPTPKAFVHGYSASPLPISPTPKPYDVPKVSPSYVPPVKAYQPTKRPLYSRPEPFTAKPYSAQYSKPDLYKPTPAPYSPTPKAYSPTPTAYTPSPTAYSPTPKPYTPPTPKAYSPTPKAYSPTPKPYSPTPKAYSPTPKPYTPTPKPYTPTPKHYTPTPTPYSPRPKAYSPGPKAYSPSPKPYTPTPKPYSPTPRLYSPTPSAYTPKTHPTTPSPVYTTTPTPYTPYTTSAPTAAYHSPTPTPLAHLASVSPSSSYHHQVHPDPVPHPDVEGEAHDYDYYEKRPYAFTYGVRDEYSGNDFHREEISSGHVTKGSYKTALPDGRIQIVTYVADENGYKASVTYEGEPTYPKPEEYGAHFGDHGVAVTEKTAPPVAEYFHSPSALPVTPYASPATPYAQYQTPTVALPVVTTPAPPPPAPYEVPKRRPKFNYGFRSPTPTPEPSYHHKRSYKAAEGFLDGYGGREPEVAAAHTDNAIALYEEAKRQYFTTPKTPTTKAERKQQQHQQRQRNQHHHHHHKRKKGSSAAGAGRKNKPKDYLPRFQNFEPSPSDDRPDGTKALNKQQQQQQPTPRPRQVQTTPRTPSALPAAETTPFLGPYAPGAYSASSTVAPSDFYGHSASPSYIKPTTYRPNLGQDLISAIKKREVEKQQQQAKNAQ